MGLTLVEKIATRYAVGLKPGESALQGSIVTIRPKHVMTHDNTGAVIPKFTSIFPGGVGPKVADPHQPVFAIDHDIQNHSPENLGKYAKIKKFADRHGVDFYPAGTGISHQVMVEQGYAVPGSMIVGSDSHSNLYGAVGALGTPVVRTDAACIWATGQTWWQVPKVARCVLKGKLQPGVVGKDVIIALCGLFNRDEVLNHAIEFVGEGVASLSMDQRMSIANMTTEWGALAGVFGFDQTLKDYLYARADYFASSPLPGSRREGSLGKYTRADVDAWWDDRLEADGDAAYAVELELDLATVIPHVCGPNEVKTMASLPAIAKKRIAVHRAYLLSCVNARQEDLSEAAAIVKGKKIADRVSFYVAAASAEVQRQAEDSGDWRALLDAGAIPLPSGCGPCIGLGEGTTKPGEVAISATNRNFKGRMGSADSLVYLGSPAVVAASALAGYICAPTDYEDTEPVKRITVHAPKRQTGAAVTVIDRFPEKVAGRALYMPKDNLNTDGIYAGKWTYKDDMTPEQMKEVAFENYDPAFNDIYTESDIVVGGRNFGTGSSREQAATCLKYKGVPCVIAASYSETYRRNAFNNGFLCIECPGLVDHLAETLADRDKPTLVGPAIEVDFKASLVRVGEQTFPFPPLSMTAQELVVAGGAEAIARSRLGS
jgi:homoaconitate hydratase